MRSKYSLSLTIVGPGGTKIQPEASEEWPEAIEATMSYEIGSRSNVVYYDGCFHLFERHTKLLPNLLLQ